MDDSQTEKSDQCGFLKSRPLQPALPAVPQPTQNAPFLSSLSFSRTSSVKSCANHYNYLNFKKYLNSKAEINNKDISNLTNKLKSRNIRDIINSERITKNKGNTNLLLKISSNLKLLNKNKKLSNTKLLFKNKYNEINNRFKQVSKDSNTLMFKTFSNNMAPRATKEKKLSEKEIKVKSYSSNKHKDKINRINNIEDLFDLINEKNKKIYIRNIAKSGSLRNAERIYSKKRKDFFFTLNNDNYINDRGFRRDKIFNYIDKLRSKLNNNINNRNEEEEDTDDSDENITNLLQFVSPIKIKDSEISVKDLNLILNYLLFTKDDGNYAAHPNDKNKNIPFSRNNLCKDKNQKLDSKISKEETEQFIQELIKSFQSWNYNVNASNKFLFECLFDEKYDNLLLKIQGSNEEKEIREILKRENDDGIISVELTKIEQSLNGFKLLRNSMIKYKTDKLNKNISLKDFFGRLLKSFNNKDTALAILNNITDLEYENALFGDMPIFISDCFDYIINNLLKKYENIVKELEAQLENLKVENRKRTTILEIFRLLNEETAHLEEQDKLNKKYSDEKNFIDYLNEGKEDNEKIKYSEINNIKETIRKNLEKLLIGKIDWTKYHNEKMTTSLYLNQNKN